MHWSFMLNSRNRNLCRDTRENRKIGKEMDVQNMNNSQSKTFANFPCLGDSANPSPATALEVFCFAEYVRVL